MRLEISVESWPLRVPLAIAGYSFEDIPLLTVLLEDGPYFGRGEAYGVYYRGETTESMVAQVERVRSAIERGVSRAELRWLLPPGGARCAVDAALWELDAKRQGVAIASIAGIDKPAPVATTRTIWGDSPGKVGEQARLWRRATRIKLKLLGDGADAARVAAARAELPDATLLVDANQGFDRNSFDRLIPSLVAARVRLIEQPIPVGKESSLAGVDCPIPLAADESFQSLDDLDLAASYFQVINIKLDKCGGLTEALAISAAARKRGLQVMVGCMIATSLSMAAAFIAAQGADFADVDGPLYLARDRAYPATYENDRLAIPTELWGEHSLPWHREPV